MPTFTTPQSIDELLADVKEIDEYYKGRGYAYERYDLYDLVFDRYEYTLPTDEEIEEQATLKAQEKIAQKIKEYEITLMAEKENINYQINNSSSMKEYELEAVENSYANKIMFLEMEAVRKGIQNSSMTINNRTELETEKDYQMALINSKYIDLNVELNAKLKENEYKYENVATLFEPQIIFAKNEYIEQLKKEREEEKFNQFKYAMGQHEKEIRTLNSLNQARMQLSLEYISIVAEPMTEAQLNALGYFKDMIVVMDDYFYTLDAETAYQEFLRYGEFAYYLGSYYATIKEKYNARRQ